MLGGRVERRSPVKEWPRWEVYDASWQRTRNRAVTTNEIRFPIIKKTPKHLNRTKERNYRHFKSEDTWSKGAGISGYCTPRYYKTIDVLFTRFKRRDF